MRILKLTPALAKNEFPHTWGVLYDLAAPHLGERAQVYTHHVIASSGEYELTTTNKDLHLSFGAMGEQVREAFCDSLGSEFAKTTEPLMLSLAQDDKPESRFVSNVFVSYTKIADLVILHVSPAR